MGLDEGLGPIGNQQGPCTLRELVSDSGILPRPLPGDTPWRETEGQNRKYNAQGMMERQKTHRARKLVH